MQLDDTMARTAKRNRVTNSPQGEAVQRNLTTMRRSKEALAAAAKWLRERRAGYAGDVRASLVMLAGLLLLESCKGVQLTPSVCGNKVKEDGEDCDYGPGNDGGGRCRTDCTWKVCGDGIVDLGKAIDTDNDGLGDVPEVCDRAIPSDPPCRNDCRAFSLCGNGVVDPPDESCDTGPNRSDTTPGACRLACQRARCGDGVVDPNETCDDSNTVSGDGCDSNCTVTACGNGVTTAGEQCDDGNGVEVDSCLPSCRSNVCVAGLSADGGACFRVTTQRMRLPITLENRPNAVAIGDFDGDGRNDLAVTTALSSNVDILFGNGGGSLSPPDEQDSWDAPAFPIAVAVGNVAGAGRADVVVLSAAVGGSTTMVMANTGRRGLLDRVDFVKYQVVDPFSGPNQLVVADLDRDGQSDVVFTGAAQLGIARMTRDTFNRPVLQQFTRGVFNTPRLLAVGDLDRDGHRDVVFSNLATALERLDVQPFFTNGPLTSTQLDPGALGLHAIAMADLDGDGADELIAAVLPPVLQPFIRVSFNSDPASPAGMPFFERTVDLPATVPPRFLVAAPDRIVYADQQRVAVRRFVNGAFTDESVVRVYEGSQFLKGLAIGRIDGDAVSDVAFVGDGDREEVGVLGSR